MHGYLYVALQTYLHNYEAMVYCFYSASFNENCSTGVVISLVNYLGCTGSLTTSTPLLIKPLQTYLSHFQFTEPQQLLFIAAQNQR